MQLTQSNLSKLFYNGVQAFKNVNLTDKNQTILFSTKSESTIKYFICFSFFLFSITTHAQTNATLPKEVVESIEKRIELGLNPS